MKKIHLLILSFFANALIPITLSLSITCDLYKIFWQRTTIWVYSAALIVQSDKNYYI